MKKTLLQIVQEILNDMDSEPVNTIGDSVEAEQIASVVETVYYNLVSTSSIPEHSEFFTLIAFADREFPTHFATDNNCKGINRVWYDVSEAEDGSSYREIKFLEPLDFVRHVDSAHSSYDIVTDNGVRYKVGNNSDPTYYTSFDDENIVFDSYDSSIEDTLQEYKTRVYGTILPAFQKLDNFVPDIDAVYFPYLISEAKSTCMDIYKGGTTPKIDQQSRRQKSYIQNDNYKTKRNKRVAYGRHRRT